MGPVNYITDCTTYSAYSVTLIDMDINRGTHQQLVRTERTVYGLLGVSQWVRSGFFFILLQLLPESVLFTDLVILFYEVILYWFILGYVFIVYLQWLNNADHLRLTALLNGVFYYYFYYCTIKLSLNYNNGIKRVLNNNIEYKIVAGPVFTPGAP